MTDSRAEKINKLLAKAERAGSEHEAEAFFAKAQDLMTRWAIDEAMLEAASDNVKDEILSEEIVLRRSGYFPMMAQMYIEVAEPNGVNTLIRPPSKWGTRAGVVLIGWKNDIERVKMLASSLLLQCVRESHRVMPEMYHQAGTTEQNGWRRAFRMAYAVRVGQRVREQVRLTKQEVKKETGSDFLPVLVNRADRINDFMNSNFNVKARAPRQTKYDRNGYEAGHVAADRADLGNTRVGGNRKEIG